MKKVILFDLDGTLTDSSEGIIRSVIFMLEKMKLEVPDEATLRSFIGPPMVMTLHDLYGLSEKESRSAIQFYREYFAQYGIDQLRVYEGIVEVLNELAKEYRLVLATSKPEVFAQKIMDKHRLSTYFSGIFGADMEGQRESKEAVIAYAMAHLSSGKRDMVMIGDRKFDIEGAKKNNLSSIGVLYGFGDQEELEEAGADQIIAAVQELPFAVKSIFGRVDQ